MEVASRLKQVLRNGDTVARLGGDEFVLLLSGLDDIGKCQQALDRVLHTIAQPYQLGKGRLANLSASIGVTLYPVDGADADSLAPRRPGHVSGKQAGRHRYHLFDPEHDRQARPPRGGGAHRGGAERWRIQAVLPAQGEYAPRRGGGRRGLIRWQHPSAACCRRASFAHHEDSEFSVELNG